VGYVTTIQKRALSTIGRTVCTAPVLLSLLLSVIAFMVVVAPASARTTRPYQGSFGSLTSSLSLGALAVDQASGDVYATNSKGSAALGCEEALVSRFTAAGTPDNFTVGPNAGTNTLMGFPCSGALSVAIDNSGGPLNGTIYVAVPGLSSNSPGTVKVFASSGASLGTISGSGAPAGAFDNTLRGIAVDQANGALYVSEGDFPSHVWRYSPSSPSGAIDDSDYALSGIAVPSPTGIAVAFGSVYALQVPGGDKVLLTKYAASDFGTNFSAEPTHTTIDLGDFEGNPTAIAIDPKNGDLYVDERDRIAVFDSSGLPLYTFGSGYFGGEAGGHPSEAVAVKSAASGPAAKVYVGDYGPSLPGSAQEIDAFGALAKAPTFTHLGGALASLGPDGTAASSFSSGPGPLAFDQATRRLYAADAGVPGIYGFDASAPPAFPPLGGFSPLASAAFAAGSGLAVDNTALSSAGNLYLASQSTDLLYGWNASGTPLGGAFPVDPAASPGGPDGSPKDLCGAAVDSAGNIWVANKATKRILKYSSAGASLPGSIDTSAQGTPCRIAFDSGDDLYIGIAGSQSGKSGVWKYTAASGYSSATRIAQERPDAFIAVDPSTDRLYVTEPTEGNPKVDIYDPTGQLLDRFDLGASVAAVNGIGVDATNHVVYVADNANHKVHAFPPGLLLPEVTARAASGQTNTTATLNGLVGDQGVALNDCHFEYVSEAAFRKTGFSDLSSGGSVPCSPAAASIPLDLDDHPVSATATGLSENTAYRFRLAAASADGSSSVDGAAFLSAGRPLVETTGSPVRSATTARLEGRVYAHGEASTYHFEFGSEGPCDANPCEATEAHSAGSGEEIQLVAQQVEGLQPNTTYHYRLIADNGNPLGSGNGNDMTVTTRASDAPLSHGRLPGPPGSDRAYEMVSLPDSGGNPVITAFAVSDDGNRAVYRVNGGTPISKSGTSLSSLYAERTEVAPHLGGWRSEDISPPRDQVGGGTWVEPAGRTDLSDQVVLNVDTSTEVGEIWRLRPGQPAALVYQPKLFRPDGQLGEAVITSDDASRVVVRELGTLDPAHPVPPGVENLYDVSSGTPKLVGFLPDGSIPACGATTNIKNGNQVSRAPHWLSSDGSLLFFESCTGLFMRDLDAEETRQIGPGAFIKWTPGAVFFSTTQSLNPGDTGGTDIYRYEIGSEALKCVTCVLEDQDVNITGSVAVAADGSRVYFRTDSVLAPGAASPGVYRVNVASGDLAYVAPIGSSAIGETAFGGQAITPDGSVLVFASDHPGLNAVGGQQNGGTRQYYRYDDRDRSLTCLSCPQDGSDPVDSVLSRLLASGDGEGAGANKTALSADGKTFAFATPTSLLKTDQNTFRPGQEPQVGTDVYEWRDGQLLLITNGLTEWPVKSPPYVSAITPSGNDIFFAAAAQYTQDALDGYQRLYDARIGGGFEFPPSPKPCPLEVCQGTPKGAPEERAPGTGSFAGASTVGTTAPRSCPKGRHKVRKGGKARCVKSQSRKHRRAKHDRRAPR
jgi:hypothetical protein